MPRRKADELPLELHALPLELHALKILGKRAEKVRDKLCAASGQAVDFTVRVSGSIDVQADIEFDRDQKPDVADVLTIVLANVGPRIRNAVVDALSEAYSTLRRGGELELDQNELKHAQGLLQQWSWKAKKKQRGGVVGSLKLEKLA